MTGLVHLALRQRALVVLAFVLLLGLSVVGGSRRRTSKGGS